MRIVASFVLRLIDSFSKKNVHKNSVKFMVNGVHFTPMHKEDMYFVFVNMPETELEIEILSQIYNSEKIRVNPAAGKGRVHVVALNPSRYYVLIQNAAVISGRVVPESDNSEIPYKAHISEGAEIFKIAQDDLSEGSMQLKLYSDLPKTAFPIPGKFLIIDKNKEKSEICLVTEYDGEFFKVESGLLHSHARATPLTPVIEGKTDENGRFYIVFSKIKNAGKQPQAVIVFERNDKTASIDAPLNYSSETKLEDIVF